MIQQEAQNIPDAEFYHRGLDQYLPVFCPWLGYGDFSSYLEIARLHTIVSADRLYMIYSLALQSTNIAGQFYECGVYKGGSALLLGQLVANHCKHANTELHLFDTFEGMPETDQEKDVHRRGDFSDLLFEEVRAKFKHMPHVRIHRGYIPATFAGLEDHRLAFAHIDVDIYQSVLDCCNFVYPKLNPGGTMIFDDYGFASCPGARQAVDAFFSDKRERPIVLPTGQAFIFKLGDPADRGVERPSVWSRWLRGKKA